MKQSFDTYNYLINKLISFRIIPNFLFLIFHVFNILNVLALLLPTTNRHNIGQLKQGGGVRKTK